MINIITLYVIIVIIFSILFRFIYDGEDFSKWPIWKRWFSIFCLILWPLTLIFLLLSHIYEIIKLIAKLPYNLFKWLFGIDGE